MAPEYSMGSYFDNSYHQSMIYYELGWCSTRSIILTSSVAPQLISSNRLNHYQLLHINWRLSINEYPLFTAQCIPLPHSADS
jgi:hypothetical protein